MKRLYNILLIIVILAPSAFASERDKTSPPTDNKPFKTQYTIGLNGMIESSIEGARKSGGNSSSDFVFDYGVSFEARFTHHSGIETGLYCRTMNFHERGDMSGANLDRIPRSYGRYLSIPVLYKFYSRILNFAVGFNYDILIDELNRDPGDTPRHDFGAQLKVTKDIKLYKGLILEPFLMANQCLTGRADRTWVSAGLGVKYRF